MAPASCTTNLCTAMNNLTVQHVNTATIQHANELEWFDHPFLSNTIYTDTTKAISPKTEGLGTESDSDCPICVLPLAGALADLDNRPGCVEGVTRHSSCGRTFHNDCFAEWIKNAPLGQTTCPMCREDLGLVDEEEDDPDGASVQHWDVEFDEDGTFGFRFVNDCPMFEEGDEEGEEPGQW